MTIEIVMPKLGDTLVDGKVGRWLKHEGDYIGLNEPVVEIETDKVTTEIPVSTVGVLLKIVVPEGQVARVGAVLGYVGESNALTTVILPPVATSASANIDATINVTASGPALAADVAATTISPVAARFAAEHGIVTSQIKGNGLGGRIMKNDVAQHVAISDHETSALAHDVDRALPSEMASDNTYDKLLSPLVARLAAHYHVDLQAMAGSGKGARVQRTDIMAYLQERGIVPTDAELTDTMPSVVAAGQSQSPALRQQSPRQVVTSPDAAPSVETLIPHTMMRRSIADHMVASVRSSPHVTTIMEADLSAIVAHRTINKSSYAQQNVKLTFTPYFIVAAAAALSQHPLANSSWLDDGVQVHGTIDIGVATALAHNGLIVPVIRRANEQSLLNTAFQVGDLSARARSNRLKPDEITQSTFTVSNHGITGSLMATPIINQPQSAILGVGLIEERVKAVRGTFAIRPMVYLSLSFDHRILDGASADRFLNEIKNMLENWHEI